jgi:hypothetical protein
MREQKNIRQELREQKAEHLLAEQGKVPEWELPAGYLEQLTEEVLKTTTSAKVTHAKVVRFNDYWRIAVAAVIVLALGCWYWYPQPSDNSPIAAAEPDWSGIATEDLNAYVMNHIDDFEVGLLAASAFEAANEMIPGNGISTQVLEEYLEADDWLNEIEVSELFEDNI